MTLWLCFELRAISGKVTGKILPSRLRLLPPLCPTFETGKVRRVINCHDRRDDDKRPCRLFHSQKIQMARFRMKQKPDET
ncbi:hypothetical protein [Bartonella choladocola]|uniref:hypothetical protein n=1 Tax=Bartonella choladocola TaxID=2750995 RepID=UPI003B52440B